MKVAIIGCGAMGAVHAEAAVACGLKVTHCADATKARGERLARVFGAKNVSTEDAFSSSGADAVVITTPTPTHLEYIRAASDAKQDIFCERPLARNTSQCEQALSAAENAGVKLFVAHTLRYSQEFTAISEQVLSDKIGDVGFIRTYRGGACPAGTKKWYRDYNQSGGVLLETLVDDFDWIQYRFGPVDTVFSQNLLLSTPQAMDYALVTLTLESGALAQVVGSWAHPSGWRVKVELCGTGGMIQYDSEDAPIWMQTRDRSSSGNFTTFRSNPTPKSPFHSQWEDFIGWVRDDIEPRTQPEEAMAAVCVSEAALKSALSGKTMILEEGHLPEGDEESQNAGAIGDQT